VSTTQAAPAPPLPPGFGPSAAAVGPWTKVLIVGICVALAVGIFWLFSGKIGFLHRHEAEPEAAPIAVSGGHTMLERQPLPAMPVEEPLPPVSKPAMLPQAMEDPRLKAMQSPINAYHPTSAANTSSAPAASHGALPADSTPDALEASLVPTKMDGTRVAELPNPRWLIEAGRLLPCVQITKINSTLPGAVTATLSEPVRGETGDVILLGKGARVFGTVQHGLQNGAEVLSVLWQHITTPVLYDDRGMPHQFRIAVNSPASSELGETGLDGEINRHLWKKIGGIIGMSVIQTAVGAGGQALSNATQRSNGNTNLNFNTFQNSGQTAADELMRQWVEIPDVLLRNQGKNCSIYVVRDLDMHGAYQLQQQYTTVAQ
jgi:type IV secretion system protein VirB10